MPSDLDPEARLDALRRHDPRRLVGTRLHDVHPGRPPGRLDRLSDGFHGLVEGSTRIEAETGGPPTAEPEERHTDRKNEQGPPPHTHGEKPARPRPPDRRHPPQ